MHSIISPNNRETASSKDATNQPIVETTEVSYGLNNRSTDLMMPKNLNNDNLSNSTVMIENGMNHGRSFDKNPVSFGRQSPQMS